ncbi:MAG: HAD-IA family hydrolase [Rhodomicrobium sp.]|jgi:HAD superfamily hydrolase (TIGR01509 family)
MSTLEALIFDVDGTLADTERDGHRVAFNRAFADAGLDWHWGVALYGDLLSVTGGKERLTYYLQRYLPDFQPPDGAEKFVARLHALKTRHYLEILAERGIPLRPGVERLLTEAREAGLRLAIATTTTAVNVAALLESVLPGKLGWFEVIGAGDVVAAKKPAPDIYAYVLGELRLRPEQCLAFEDSELGLRSSLAAGIETIVTVNSFTVGQDFAGAALVIDNLGEPRHPFHVLAGNSFGGTVLDVKLLRQVFDAKSG